MLVLCGAYTKSAAVRAAWLIAGRRTYGQAIALVIQASQVGLAALLAMATEANSTAFRCADKLFAVAFQGVLSCLSQTGYRPWLWLFLLCCMLGYAMAKPFLPLAKHSALFVSCL